MLPVTAAAASSDESATQHTLQQQQLLRQTAAPKPPGATCWLTHACCAAADNAACHPRCPACAWVGVRGGDRSYAADSGWPWAEPQATAACHREPACCCWAGYLDHCQSCCCHCWVVLTSLIHLIPCGKRQSAFGSRTLSRMSWARERTLKTSTRTPNEHTLRNQTLSHLSSDKGSRTRPLGCAWCWEGT
jgi:hypothetical protein